MEDVFKYIEICFLVLCLSVNPHIKKKIMTGFDDKTYYYINTLIITCISTLKYAWFYFRFTNWLTQVH